MKKRNVLVVVDVQNDFVKGGVLAYGYPKKSNTELICERVHQALVEGYRVIATRDTHQGNSYFGTLEGEKLPVKHCIAGTHGWELVEDIQRLVDDRKIQVVNKETFGAIYLADRIEDAMLPGEDFDEIEVIGYDLSICVLANAVILRANFPNTVIKVRTALCGDVNKEMFDAACTILRAQQIEVL